MYLHRDSGRKVTDHRGYLNGMTEGTKLAIWAGLCAAVQVGVRGQNGRGRAESDSLILTVWKEEAQCLFFSHLTVLSRAVLF